MWSKSKNQNTLIHIVFGESSKQAWEEQTQLG